MRRTGRAHVWVWGAAAAVSLLLSLPAYGAVEIFDMDTEMTESGPQEAEEDPLAQPGEWIETGPIGSEPETLVEDTRILEKYIAERGIYESAIKNKYIFYTNVSNGGVAGESVYFDTPPEIAMSLEKGGDVIPYETGRQIVEPGDYQMNFSVVEPGRDGRQVEYRAVFRFKIREKEEPVTEEAQDDPESPDRGEEEEPRFEIPEYEIPKSGTPDWETWKAKMSQGELDRWEGPEEGMDAEWDELPQLPQPMGGLQTEEPQDFIHRLAKDVELSCSVPNGAITSRAVNLKIRGTAPFTVYKDEEPIEWDNGMTLQDTGNYAVVSGGESFSFRISSYFTRSRWFYAPEGFQIESVSFKNNEIDIEGGDRFELGQDGTYQVELVNEEGIMLVSSFVKDSTPPEFTVTPGKKGVVVEYRSDDVEEVVVYKDGEEIKPTFNNSYSEAGDYEIVLYDRAGNFKEKGFHIAFRMNAFSILLMLLTAGIVLALFATILVTKNKIKIR